jgi:hypothetical protein
MWDLALAAAVTAGVLVLYAVLGVLWRWRAARDRRVAVLLLGLSIDPYLVYLARYRHHEGLWREVAAELLIAELLTVDERGALHAGSVAGSAEHPLAAALLEHVRRADMPVVVTRLSDDAELRRRLRVFEREENARLVYPARFRRDGLDAVGGCAAVLLGAFYTVLLVYVAPEGHRSFAESLCPLLVLGPIFIGGLGWLHNARWPDRRDPFREHCATLPMPNATGRLDSDRLRRLDTSLRERRAYWEEHERMRDAFDADSGGS